MASNITYLEMVKESSEQKQLQPPHALMEALMKLKQPHEKVQETLLQQVKVAREKNNLTWLRRAANEANLYQFESRAWIEKNIDKLNPIKRQASTSNKRMTDYRVDTRPGMERRVDEV